MMLECFLRLFSFKLLWLSPALILLTKVEPGGACFRHHYFNQRLSREKHVFVRDEYIPQTNELFFTASGPITSDDFIFDPKRLARVDDRNIRFLDENSRRMSERCREKVIQLALLVKVTWPRGVFLEVMQAWLPPKEVYYRAKRDGPHDAFHFAGRAVNLKLYVNGLDPGHVSLGRLAMMASFEATFDWCILTSNRVLSDHVHCSVKPDRPMLNRWSGCLHGNSIVRTGNGTRRVQDLQIGDRVLSLDVDNRPVLTTIVTFLHRDTRLPLSFLIVHFYNSTSTLTVTPNHLVFKMAAGSANLEAVFASSVRPNDRLIVHEAHNVLGRLTVSKIERLLDRGAFAPVTESGTILVNSFYVSTYAQVRSHRMAHAALWPLRVARRLGISNQGKPEPFSQYGRVLMWLASWVLPKNWFFQEDE